MSQRIFISYAREDDEPFAGRIYDDLTKAGFEVWWDRVSMPSRQLTFQQEIADAIRSHDRLILIVGPRAAASDYVRAVAEQLNPWIPGGLCVLGTDGMGRSDTRENLRRHFEIDAQHITIAALYQLHKKGQIEAETVAAAIRDLELDPDKVNPMFA